MRPLYKWAGGKRRLLKHYSPLLPQTIDRYCEPFFGAGAVFCHVMNNHDVKEAFINDISPELMGIYVAIRDDFDRFIALMLERSDAYIPLDKEGRIAFYDALRMENAWDYEKWDDTEAAAALYFLMLTCFNGLFLQRLKTNMRFGTSHGHMKEKDCVIDVENLREWHEALQRTTITSGDWRDAVVDDAFVFLDPPYRDASDVDYCSPFTETDLLELIELGQRRDNVWVTNRDIGDGFFERHRGDMELRTFPIRYTAGKRIKGMEAKKATEILLTS